MIILLFLSCSSDKPQDIHTLPEDLPEITTHAQLLQLKETEGITFCSIKNPWDTTSTLATYLLLQDTMTHIPEKIKKIVEDTHQEIEIVRTPIKSNALTTSCHAYLLEQLNGLDRLSVLCDASFTMSPTIKELLRQGKIVEGGNSMSPNTELLCARSVDAIWISPFKNIRLSQLKKSGLHIIQCADYMELTPLGRAEWIKLYGRLIGKAAIADSIYTIIENNYLQYNHSIDTLHHRPTLLCESIYGGTWYVPGGESYMSKIYRDAGADYYWKEDDHTGSIALSPEAVYARAADCDIWLIKTHDPADRLTLDRFLSQHHYYPRFAAGQKGNIYVCNTAFSNYHEETPFRPDLLLQEINTIIHNYDLPSEKKLPTRYFQPLLRADTLHRHPLWSSSLSWLCRYPLRSDL